MKKLLLGLSVLLISLGACAQTPKSEDELLKNLVEKERIVGMAAAYSIDGEIAWKNAEGFACKDDKIPFSTTTLTRPASVAKAMTAVAIMQLVEQEKLDLDENIQTYLSSFPTKAKGQITTRQLLTHTSGVDGYINDEAENKRQFDHLAEAIAVFEDRPLKFEPGSQFSYTTYGYVILGRVIEEISGQSYEQYMQENIWNPAQMTNTYVEHLDKNYENKSCLYTRKRRKAKEAKANNLSNRVPGGGLITTVEDLVKFGNALLENKLIKAETFALMRENQTPNKVGNPYGLGVVLYGQAEDPSSAIGHAGAQTGSSAQIMIISSKKTVIVALANTSHVWEKVIGFTVDLIGFADAKGEKG